MLISIYIYYLDKFPVIIKQNRVGLHGKQFSMYKFRTMKNNSHELRGELEELNKNDEVIFKIENDPTLAPSSVGYEKSKSDYSFGFEFRINDNFSVGVASERGNL